MSIPADRSRLHQESRSCSSPPSETAAERLTDDLLVEILSRVPAKSLCRFKCVSKHWLSLIEHPDHRKKLLQTLAGFFYCSTSKERLLRFDLHFFDVSGSGRRRRRPLISLTSLDFPPNYRGLYALDCCNGLLLCRWYGAPTAERRYVVCNPATEKSVILSAPKHTSNVKLGAMRLGFDPAVSSHFYVFALLQESHIDFAGVYVYSSENGRWVHNKEGWIKHDMFLLSLHSPMVFLNGCLHFQACSSETFFCIGAVDTKGETRMHFPIPGEKCDGFLQQSQGCLHYAEFQKKKDDIVARL